LRLARIRLTNAQADKEELNIEILRGDYIARTEIEQRLSQLFAELRVKVLELPTHARTHMALSAAQVETLTELCRETLRVLSKTVTDSGAGDDSTGA
jgi:phage terminase Nu1 subunit (DNA packaging protein)